MFCGHPVFLLLKFFRNMKKTLTCIFPLFLLFSISGFSQGFFDPIPTQTLDTVSLIITYSNTFTPDSLNLDDKREIDVILLIGNKMSLYQCKNSFNRERILKGSRNMEELRERAKRAPSSSFSARFFKNFPLGKITTTERIMGDHFIFEEYLKPFNNWKITGETSRIKDFSVQKATVDFAGRSWVAWFSPEIPISDGPHKFMGLPGLILKLHDTKNHHKFELVSIEKPKETLLIELPKRRSIKTTKAKFWLAREAFRQSIIKGTFELITDPEAKHVAAENMRRRNNPIELSAD